MGDLTDGKERLWQTQRVKAIYLYYSPIMPDQMHDLSHLLSFSQETENTQRYICLLAKQSVVGKVFPESP